MKKRVLFIFLAFAILGCKPENLEGVDGITFFSDMKFSAPSSFIPKTCLPGWLKEKVDVYEDWHSNGGGLWQPIQFFRGKWENRTVIFIYHPLNSCIFCDVYYNNGEKFVLDEFTGSSFQTTSTNWVLIYEIKREK